MGSYDHKRRHAARVGRRPYVSNAPVPVWDFVVDRTDGTRVRFHPDQTRRTISIADMPFEYERDGPASFSAHLCKATSRAAASSAASETLSACPCPCNCAQMRQQPSERRLSPNQCKCFFCGPPWSLHRCSRRISSDLMFCDYCRQITAYDLWGARDWSAEFGEEDAPRGWLLRHPAVALARLRYRSCRGTS